MSSYENFRCLLADQPFEGVLRLTLDGENIHERLLHAELAAIWKEIETDQDTRVVLLRGVNGGMSGKGSLDAIESLMGDYTERIRVLREARDLVFNVLGFSKILVSALDGAVLGAPLVPALLADISIASRTATLLDGHTRMGLAAGDHAAICWPLLCGMAKAKYYLMTGTSISGEEAERIGLVSLCVDDDARSRRRVLSSPDGSQVDRQRA